MEKECFFGWWLFSDGVFLKSNRFVVLACYGRGVG